MQTSNSTSTFKNSTPTSKLLVISRDFNVPVAELFKAFASGDALMNWWWPNGLSTDRVDYDFAEGGHYFINMVGDVADKGGGGMTGDFEEIIPNKRIVMTDYFADKNGNAISGKEAGMPGVWPETAYITLEFSDLGARSRLLLSQQGVPNESQADCVQGWNESFDKLADYLARSVQ